MNKKVVLAYSGGLDTSCIVPWLREKYSFEVIAYTADLGQVEDLEAVRQKALSLGASRAIVEDVREEFVKDFIFPLLKARAIYQGGYLLGTSIARPLIAKGQLEVARREGATFLAHGATGKGNDQVRFELTYMALEPRMKVIAPWREWDMKSRQELIEYAKKHNIQVDATRERPYSVDKNLFHTSYEGGILEDPWMEPPEDMFDMTSSPEKAPDKSTTVEIAFEQGEPRAIDGKPFSPACLLQTLNTIGGQNAIGRVDMVEDRFVGMKSRGVYETPGGTILHTALRAMESITMDREVMALRDSLSVRYAQLVYNGFWFSPEMRLLNTMIKEAHRDVTGLVRLKLYKGNCTVAGRKAEKSLYEPSFATFEEEEVYNQKDAEGFIKLNALRLKIRRLMGF